MHPIEKAVAPLKIQAMEGAERWAREVVESVRLDLIAADWDVKVAAPYPHSSGGFAFHVALRRYNTFAALTKWVKASCGMNDPCPVTMPEDRVERFVKNARDGAAASYVAYVQKLLLKVGPGVVTATLDENGVWGYSHLTVTFENKAPEVWHTRQIANVSKLGKYFPQWPTRKVKNYKPEV